LNLGMKCWNSAFNAQCLRITIVVVHVGELNMYVATVQALVKKGTQDETQFTTKSYVLLQNYHSQLLVWCPIMLKPAVLIP
jgi:hypothetical protein